MDKLSVTQVEHEQGRFFVASGSRPIEHVVDLFYQEEPRSKPKAACGCEDSHIKGHICKHILRAVEFELKRLELP